MSKFKDTKTLKGMNAAKLGEELQHAQSELFTARVKHSQGELKDTHQLRAYRRYVAKLKTFLSLAS